MCNNKRSWLSTIIGSNYVKTFYRIVCSSLLHFFSHTKGRFNGCLWFWKPFGGWSIDCVASVFHVNNSVCDDHFLTLCFNNICGKKRATTTTYEYAYIPNGRHTEDEIIINLRSKITGLIHAHAKCAAFRIFWIFDAKTQCNTSTIEIKSEKTSLSEKWNDKWMPPTEDTYSLLKCYECCWINMKIFAHPRLLLYFFFFCWCVVIRLRTLVSLSEKFAKCNPWKNRET